MDMDMEEVRQQIKQKGKFTQLHHVATFKGYRDNEQGRTRWVTVEIWDAGPDAHYRYRVIATDEDGRKATGNGGDTISQAIFTTHWEDLDRDRPF